MNGRKKELKSKNDTPALKRGETEGAETRTRAQISRWYKLYLATTLSAVCLAVIFLAVGISSKISLPNVENIASGLLYGELMDISGGISYNKNEIKDNYDNVFDVSDGILIPSKDPDDSSTVVVPDRTPETEKSDIYAFDYSKVPEGETAIIPMDLSLSSNGSTYIYNSTGYSPDLKALLTSSFTTESKPIYLANTTTPLVLIVHTHGTESYSADGAISYLDDRREIARSENTSENVVAVGTVIADILNQNGIPTLHCTIMHDRVQYKDSYARAEETIRQYLEKYPSIKLVIDLHRDAVVKSTGELVRPVTEIDSEAVAQVMCVVGSDWGGEACPSWQNNLSLSLKLRDSLNSKYGNLCRPTYLRASTYNQELAPYSLLLEIGASGNSLAEAKRAAALVANELLPLIKMM
ncbi:MAG: stage II sporulation protein P [Clostridia bacterium]|nr:stage II sporulation protein P [Clostridia bacterium]